MSERLDYIKNHFEEQEKIKVEVPVFISETSKGNVHYYFTGRRCGYDFKPESPGLIAKIFTILKVSSITSYTTERKINNDSKRTSDGLHDRVQSASHCLE